MDDSVQRRSLFIGLGDCNTEVTASVLMLGEAKLHFARGGWAKINSEDRLELSEGRLLVSTAARLKTTVVASGMVIHLGANSSAEIFVDQFRTARVISLDGTVAVGAATVQNLQPLARDTTAVFDPAKKTIAVSALADADKERERVTHGRRTTRWELDWDNSWSPTHSRARLSTVNVARSLTHLVLAPPVALVQIDQSFYNPYPRSLEGTFVFNLPRGVSVSRFAMYVGPHELVEGESIDRRRERHLHVDRAQPPRSRDSRGIGRQSFSHGVFPIFGEDVNPHFTRLHLAARSQS